MTCRLVQGDPDTDGIQPGSVGQLQGAAAVHLTQVRPDSAGATAFEAESTVQMLIQPGREFRIIQRDAAGFQILERVRNAVHIRGIPSADDDVAALGGEFLQQRQRRRPYRQEAWQDHGMIGHFPDPESAVLHGPDLRSDLLVTQIRIEVHFHHQLEDALHQAVPSRRGRCPPHIPIQVIGLEG